MPGWHFKTALTLGMQFTQVTSQNHQGGPRPGGGENQLESFVSILQKLTPK
jgi:hypothetical protein